MKSHDLADLLKTLPNLPTHISGCQNSNFNEIYGDDMEFNIDIQIGKKFIQIHYASPKDGEE